MINIVVLMAGKGERFRKAGYARDKPFIKIGEKIMAEMALESLKIPNARYTIAIRESFLSEYPRELSALSEKFGAKMAAVRRATTGAAATALWASLELSRGEAVVFADSDNIYTGGIFMDFIEAAQSSRTDAFLLTVKSSDARFSFVEFSGAGEVVGVREKLPVSDCAVAGAYYFSSAEIFTSCAIDTVIYPSDKECYMSSVCNSLVARGGKIGVFRTQYKNFKCVGTPEQLDAFIRHGK